MVSCISLPDILDLLNSTDSYDVQHLDVSGETKQMESVQFVDVLFPLTELHLAEDIRLFVLCL